MVPSRLLSLALLAAIASTACRRAAPPVLSGFNVAGISVPAGSPRAVVMIQGSNLESGRILWDAGTPAERVLPGGYLGAFMFSVPDNATGPHSVAVANAGGQSANLTFTVNPPLAPFPAPRIDHIMLHGAQFTASGQVTATLYVQGANIDVGAVVRINGVDVATTAHKTLLNDWHGVPASELGYPIYHYLSTFAIAGTRPANSTLNVTVRNLDGKVSPVFQYRLPSNAAGLDSDGDRLLDSWETAGYDANGDGVVDVNLPALGADPKRRDLFVELDVMEYVQHKPDASVFAAAQAMFQAAPIINPLTANKGINLVLDVTGKPCLRAPVSQGTQSAQRCSFQFVEFDIGHPVPVPLNANAFVSGVANFSRLKAESFDDAKRGRIYHYGIWGIDKTDGLSGESDFADDFVVTFDNVGEYALSYQTVRSQIEQLVHELGHNLRQLHGGDAHQPIYKPNYLSVMSHGWDLRTGWPYNWQRQDFVTCLPAYYAAAGADEVGGVVPAPVSTVVDYSEGMAKPLARPASQSAAPPTLCGKVVKWGLLQLGVGTVKDFANWPALAFDGPELNVPPGAIGIRP